jgi:hypothetical protein
VKRAAPSAPAVASLVALTAASAAGAQSAAADPAASLAAFARVAQVLKSPRCQNCHTVSGFPTQGDDRHRHQMNVMRGADGHGAAALHCATCHGKSNNPASGVPGADDDWHLAPLSMGWQGLSTRQLCLHLKDPQRNGQRTAAAVIDHLKTHLVSWAWEPGTDAHGVPRSVPPLSYADFLRAANSWVATGQACPGPQS